MRDKKRLTFQLAVIFLLNIAIIYMVQSAGLSEGSKYWTGFNSTCASESWVQVQGN